jgi:uncharacterized protein involved in response to NO
MATIIDDLCVSCEEPPGGAVGRWSEMPPLFGHVVMAIPRYRSQQGPALLSAGFRPFFLLSAAWASLAVPMWVAAFAGQVPLPTALPPIVWHVHEMVFGFAAATVAGFLLTAIPNWTGRMPLQGGPLGVLAVLWLSGRVAMLLSLCIGAGATAAVDLAFPLVFLGVIAREIIAGHNWRNLPMLAALACLLAGNALVHLDAVGLADTAAVGNRIGVATLLMLISFVGGRIIPSFTRNWLVKQRPDVRPPAAFNWLDRVALVLTAVALAFWVLAPNGAVMPWVCLVAGVAVSLRLARWRGLATLGEPMLWVLHLGYAWLAIGFLLLGLDALVPFLSQTTALHALTVGAVGCMTLAVMTRATLGHTGRPVTAGAGTTTIFGLVTLAAVLRLLAPLGGAEYATLLWLAAIAWSGAYGLFLLLYLRLLAFPRTRRDATLRPI